MRPKTNRLLMLLVGAVISGCASQTDRSSSGGGAQNRSQPDQESVQFINRPLDESPRPKPAPAAVTRPTEAPAEFPVTTYELPQDQSEGDVEDIGLQEDESVSSEQEAALAPEGSVGDTTEFDDGLDEDEVEDLGAQDDESMSEEQAAALAPESSVVATTEFDDGLDEDEVEDLGAQDDESVSEEQAAALAPESSVVATTEFDDGLDEVEVEDLGTQPDESVSVAQAPVAPVSSLAGTAEFDGEDEDQTPVEDLGTQPDESGKASFPEQKLAQTNSVVGSTQFLTLSAEAEPLFSFDKASLRSDQQTKLDELVEGLSGTKVESISIVGHADKIGKTAYNQNLSERRAAAVKAYLVKKGIPSRKIQVEGRGESEPVTGDTCSNTRGKALISCLQPDRRVEVKVEATKTAN